MATVHPTKEPLDIAALARREEQRNARGLSEVANEQMSVAGGFVGRAEAGSWLNQATGVGYGMEVTREDVERIIAFHEEVGAEPRIEVSAFCDPSLIRHVNEAGFRIASSGFLGGFEHVLVRVLSQNGRASPRVEVPEGLELGLVDPSDAREVREYAHVAISGFLPEGQALSEVDLEICARCVRHPRTLAAVARLDGRIVGAGAMEISGPETKIAALFGLSVLPEYRRRGIQQALIAYRLNIASERGMTVATIGSRPGAATERNVRRMGFELGYTKVIMVRPGPGLKGVSA
ncbi:MAG: GNAT family N-acetyltransferase [Phycisphaeraceae bacterium]|nr:GNAT family N-acetyltransferase [Phycisphaeraceae bacterium]